MTIYSGPVFEMAREQFRKVADHISLPEDERGRLLYPKRAICVSIPIHRDDARTEVFEGFRVQHHLTLGPTKGGDSFCSNPGDGRGGGAGRLDELEMRSRGA
jgi:glutamate dehydrogenase (NAD(P)+)